MLIVKIIESNTMCSVQELNLCIFLVKVIWAIFASSKFEYILQLIYLLTFFYTCNFHSLNIHQHHMIYHIYNHNCSDSKQILYHIHLFKLILCIHTCIYHHSNVVYYYKRFHLIYIHTYTFHTILCVLFH